MNRVFCYRNLNRKGVTWSVKDVRSGLVIDRTHKVVLKNVDLKVSQAGRNRVLKNKRKNVHAGIQGERMRRRPPSGKSAWLRAEYNPYKMDSFRLSDTHEPITKARYAVLTSQGLFVQL